MQHAVASPFTPDATQIAIPQPASMALDTNSQSTTSSPKSAKASIENNSASQISESTLSSTKAHELTPPSSIASTQEQNDVGKQQLAEETPRGNTATSPTVAGKKRTADGQLKEVNRAEYVDDSNEHGSHDQITDSALPEGSPSLTDLSQQLRTRLTYAMIKVQNGWQKHSIEEVESLASQSPRSTLSATTPRNRRSVVSPRTSLAFHRQMNDSDSPSYGVGSSEGLSQQFDMANVSANQMPNGSNLASLVRKLAPPASITPGPRRRPAPNVSLQIDSAVNSLPRSGRPAATQRTPSQNAAMEADAVETLMFMSASPNNSGHFPSHLSAYSPTSQVFSAQTSPVKSQFPSNVVGYSPPTSVRRKKYEDKTDLIDRLLNDLDDDESEELDRAVKIMEQHRAAKLSA